MGRQWLCPHTLAGWCRAQSSPGPESCFLPAVAGMLGAECMELVGRGCGKPPVSYHTCCLMRSKVWTRSISKPSWRGVRSGWKQLQSGECRYCHKACGHWWCLAMLTAGLCWGTATPTELGAVPGLSLCPCSVCAITVQDNLKWKVSDFSGQEKSADLFWTLIYIQVASLCLCEKAVVTPILSKSFSPPIAFVCNRIWSRTNICIF